MNPAAGLSLVACVVAAVVAMLSSRFGRAPGWRQYRALALVAATAALFAATDCFASLGVSDATLRLVMQAQGSFSALHVACWLHYVRRQLGQPARPHDRWLKGVLIALAALSLVPGATLADRCYSVVVPWLGVTYRQPEATLVGTACFAFECGVLLVPMVGYVRAMRRGFRDASVHVIALAAIFVAAVNDTLIVSGAFEGPLLVSLGFLVSVGAMGFVLTRAFVESAHELDNLSRRLEHLVIDRTRELVDAEAALLRAEQMAAIGQLSAGVAHEINNPAAAVAANVGYLRDGLATGALPADALACLDDSIESIDRIAKIVRQLLDSSRAAASARSLGCMASVGRTVQQALGDARARLAPHLTVAVDVPEGLYVRADESSLVQVLVNLLVNGAQAIPQGTASARLEVRARAEGATVTIEVIDDGAGMSEETRRRLFEPFYTTKALGDGTGLGLPVSRGLVRSMGGELYVGESRPGRTAMCVRLAAGVAPSSRPAHKPMAASAGRRSLLVVDDDPHVARALLRSLGDAFDVELASGVAHALARLGEQPFDVVLTDLQMPDGGGLRLFRELEARSPDQAARLILVTGGQTSEADLAFVGAHRLELLAKPIVTDELFEALRRVEAGHRVAA